MEQHDQTSEQAVQTDVTAVQRATYVTLAALGAGGVTELFGAGGYALGFAGIAGLVAGVCSENIRNFMLDRMPAPHGAQTRERKLQWLFQREDTPESKLEVKPRQDNKPVETFEESFIEPLVRKNERDQLTDDEGHLGLPGIVTPTRQIEDTLPRRSPTFAQMKHLFRQGQDILGYDGDEFIFADSLSQSVNMGVIGLPRSGKTVCLTFHVAQAVARNAIVRGWDLHGDVTKDLGGLFHILDDVDEIVNDCQWLDKEIKRRSALRKRALAGDIQVKREWTNTRELFFVIDEFLALMTRLKLRKPDRELVANTVLLLIAEGAKFKMRILIAGQTMPAALFGDGGSSARDILSTRYAFRSRDDQARRFGIESLAIETLLSSIASGDDECKGYAILDGGPLLHAKLVSIPFTTVDDIRRLIEETGYECPDDEDDLVSDLVSGSEERQTEKHTDELPTMTRRYGSRSGYEEHQRRKRERVQVQREAVSVFSGRETKKAEEPIAATGEIEISLQEAHRVWTSGNDSVRDLAKALDITPYRANQLYTAMVKAGMIEAKRKRVHIGD